MWIREVDLHPIPSIPPFCQKARATMDSSAPSSIVLGMPSLKYLDALILNNTSPPTSQRTSVAPELEGIEEEGCRRHQAIPIIQDQEIQQGFPDVGHLILRSQRTSDLYGEDEDCLRRFDMDMKYGPCIGLIRLERWECASSMGLNPPVEVADILCGSKVVLNYVWQG